MKTIYSPSRIGLFDNCNRAYKYKYIDRLVSDIQTIERFRGSVAHETLEEFYKLIKAGSVKPVEWILDKYEELWEKNYTSSIKIVKKELTAKDYYNKGRQSIIDYYDKYKPFDQAKVIDTERMLSFTVKHNGREYPFCGKLDRLDWDDKENMFEIHDYKLTNRLMTQEEADKDWQLGLYYVALKEKWPDVKKVRLIWHSLLFNKEITSFRSEEEANMLQKMVIEKIEEIKSCLDFYPQKSALCDWCDFQNICPLWKHLKEMEELPVNEYKKDTGVKLVTKYKELEEAKNELKEEIYKIEEEQEKIKEAAIEFAKRENISIIDGPDAQLKVDIREELKAPTRSEDQEKWENLREVLKQEGKYEEVSTVNANMLNYRIRTWPSEIIDKISKFLIRKRREMVRLIKK
ncbi:MAG: PD-(D/E)XK nuclease family protein [Candidatus Nealsonbacteria bacterium]|nr:MAG: PD-(D/E)XK nuclease family protein [Candidatus Nealsonbacteria bacterium]